MEKGFRIEQGTPQYHGGRLDSLRDSAHKHLDEILDSFCQGSNAGGAVVVEGRRLNGEVFHFKILFADVTGQKDCPFCAGTSIDGS